MRMPWTLYPQYNSSRGDLSIILLPKGFIISPISRLWTTSYVHLGHPFRNLGVHLGRPAGSCGHPSCLHFRCCVSSSNVDITNFLLSHCDIRTAPKHINDHIGPVTIKKTQDGRGRGLFATTHVTPGHLLLISNALASSHDDSHCENLFANICGSLRKSPRNLFLYYLLADRGDQNGRDVPSIEFFDSRSSWSLSLDSNPGSCSGSNVNDERQATKNMHWNSFGCQSSLSDIMNTSSLESRSESTTSTMHMDPFDEKRIFDIMHINSFESRLMSSDSDAPIRLNAMYLLPSFINHSCTPNASRLFVGDAMFVFAGRNIRENEEITMEYTDTLLPLKKREEYLHYTGYGLCCQCERCMLERSVQEHLEECSEKFIDLYDKAFEEVREMVSMRAGSSFPACEELANIYEIVRKKTMGFENLTRVQKQWILGGYSSAFLGKWFTKGLSMDFDPPAEYVNSTAMELVAAMTETVPGMPHTLSFATLLGAIGSREEALLELSNEAFKMAMDECIRVYGRQRTNVVIELLQQSLDRAPF